MGNRDQFSDASDFAQQRDTAGRSEELRVQSAVLSGDEKSKSDAALILTHDNITMSIPPANGETLGEHRRDLKKDWFFRYFEMLDRKHPRTRQCIRSLYAVGFIVLGLQSIDVFLRVTWNLGGRIAASAYGAL